MCQGTRVSSKIKKLFEIPQFQKKDGELSLTMCSKKKVQNKNHLVGGFNLSEKYESQLWLLLPIYGKIKNVPNQQPVM